MQETFLNVPLNPLRAFAIASRHKTFTAAAEHMGVTQVAISRQISILEKYLGVQLFERGARSVKLTENGRAFGREITPLFDSIERATQRLLSQEREQVVNLRIYPTLTHHFLMPALPRFNTAWPQYEIRLDTQVEPLDFRGTHLDLAIQLGSGVWKDARSRVLFPERLDLVCSPAYAEKLASGDADVRLLHSRYRRRAWEEWHTLSGIDVAFEKEIEFDSSLLTYSAAINGMGFTVGQIDILKREIETGQLVAPFQAPQQTASAIHVIWPTTKSTSTQSKRFVDWLLAECGQEPEFFKAKAPA